MKRIAGLPGVRHCWGPESGNKWRMQKGHSGKDRVMEGASVGAGRPVRDASGIQADIGHALKSSGVEEINTIPRKQTLLLSTLAIPALLRTGDCIVSSRSA